MASRNSLPNRLRNHFQENRPIYQLGLILGITLGLGGGFILAVKYLQRTQEVGYEAEVVDEAVLEQFRARPEEQVFPQPIGLESFSLRQIIDFALTAQGGRDALEAINTVRRIGVVTEVNPTGGERAMECTSLYSRPDRLRYNYRIDDVEITAATNGIESWQRFTRNGQRLPAQAMGANEARLLQQDVYTSEPLSLTLSDLSVLSRVEEPPASDRPVHAIRRDLGWMAEVLSFDQVNFLLVARDIEMPLPDETLMRVRIDYRDFRYVDRVALPFELTVSIDGMLRNVVRFESIELNVGALPFVFDPGE